MEDDPLLKMYEAQAIAIEQQQEINRLTEKLRRYELEAEGKSEDSNNNLDEVWTALNIFKEATLKDMTKVRERVEDIQTVIEAKQTAIDGLKRKNEELEERMRKLVQETADNSDANFNNKLDSVLVAINNQNRETKNEMNSFREQFGVAQAVAVEKQKEIDGLKKQNKKLEERMKLVLESVEKSNATFNNKVDNVWKAIAKLREQAQPALNSTANQQTLPCPPSYNHLPQPAEKTSSIVTPEDFMELLRPQNIPRPPRQVEPKSVSAS